MNDHEMIAQSLQKAGASLGVTAEEAASAITEIVSLSAELISHEEKVALISKNSNLSDFDRQKITEILNFSKKE